MPYLLPNEQRYLMAQVHSFYIQGEVECYCCKARAATSIQVTQVSERGHVWYYATCPAGWAERDRSNISTYDLPRYLPFSCPTCTLVLG